MTLDRFPVGTRVRVADDVGKLYSAFLGKCGVVIDFNWNRYRQEKNLPVVKLDDGTTTISGWGLWYETI